MCLAQRWRRLGLHTDNAWLAPWLQGAGGCWAVVGAVNPHSRGYPEQRNRRRHAELCARVRRLGWPAWPARGMSVDGAWIEAALWLQAPTLRCVDALACRFQQRAVLIGEGTGAARLRSYPADWLLPK